MLTQGGGGSSVELTPYLRRDELLLDRAAALESLKGIRSLFVASFAEELPHRWGLLEQAWFDAKVGHFSPDQLASYREQVESLNAEARRVAETHLSGESVWGHERAEDGIRSVNDYKPTGAGSQWIYVSPAICSAEREVISLLEQTFGPTDVESESYEFGAVSEPLAQILHTYGHAFKRLQKLDIALARIEKSLPRSRPRVTSGRHR